MGQFITYTYAQVAIILGLNKYEMWDIISFQNSLRYAESINPHNITQAQIDTLRDYTEIEIEIEIGGTNGTV